MDETLLHPAPDVLIPTNTGDMIPQSVVDARIEAEFNEALEGNFKPYRVIETPQPRFEAVRMSDGHMSLVSTGYDSPREEGLARSHEQMIRRLRTHLGEAHVITVPLPRNVSELLAFPYAKNVVAVMIRAAAE